MCARSQPRPEHHPQCVERRSAPRPASRPVDPTGTGDATSPLSPHRSTDAPQPPCWRRLRSTEARSWPASRRPAPSFVAPRATTSPSVRPRSAQQVQVADPCQPPPRSNNRDYTTNFWFRILANRPIQPDRANSKRRMASLASVAASGAKAEVPKRIMIRFSQLNPMTKNQNCHGSFARFTTPARRRSSPFRTARPRRTNSQMAKDTRKVPKSFSVNGSIRPGIAPSETRPSAAASSFVADFADRGQ